MSITLNNSVRSTEIKEYPRRKFLSGVFILTYLLVNLNLVHGLMKSSKNNSSLAILPILFFLGSLCGFSTICNSF